MSMTIIMVALILFLCVLAEKFSGRFGLPALILFMGIGMIFGSDGIFRIHFDNYEFTDKVCSIALCFIMFYGGFNTKWKAARPVAVRAILLSTVGVALTATLVGGFCYLVLGFSFADSFLVGAVLSCTDAASVFSVLRKKKVNLKYQTASMLEVESGSNDPTAYMLTVIGLAIKSGDQMGNVALVVFSQVFFGIIIGITMAALGLLLYKKKEVIPEGLDAIFMIGLVLMTFGLSDLAGGNEFLSVYIMGIVLGNGNIRGKDVMIPFFDGITGLAQIIIFFLLGLLAFPHKFSGVFADALLIAIFITLVARPIAVFALLKPFGGKVPQCLLVSWAGLRGASSIVFAIMVTIGDDDRLFHIVFIVALLSVAIQGTFLPKMASLFGMIDEDCDVRKTFNDYKEESAITMMRMYIPCGHNWENRCVSEVSIPTGSLALMIKRGDDTIIPRGDTVIKAEDNVILSVPTFEPEEEEDLQENVIDSRHEWCNKKIRELNLPKDILIALIKRGDDNIIPTGKTRILDGDIVVTYQSS
nr:potassium/proton antiporter [uncultured Dorea sp.]